MKRFSPRQFAFAFAALLSIGLALCFFWGVMITDPDLTQMHMDLLSISFIGFTGMNITSFVLILVQGGLWGLLIGWATATTLNYFAQK